MIVYCATNKINGFKYIGITTKFLDERKRQHFYQAFSEKKKNYFYRALRKYGWENFEWSIIHQASTLEELLERENFFIKEFKTFKSNGYNETVGGRGCFGWKHSEETKKKISIASKKSNKGKKLNEEHKKKIGLFFKEKTYEEIMGLEKANKVISNKSKTYEEKYGKEKSKLIKKKISKNNKSSQLNVRKKMSDSQKKLLDKNGKRTNWTEESSRRVSEAMSGGNHPSFLELSNNEIELLKKLYIDNNYVLDLNIKSKFKFSRHVLTRTLKNIGLWKTRM